MKLKPYPKYKDSGIKWIGKIPEGWEDYKIRYLGNFQNGNGFPEALQGQEEGEMPFLKVSDINDPNIVYLRDSSNYVTLKQVAENKWNVIPEKSILFPKIGEAINKNHRKINEVNVIIDNNMSAFIKHKEFNYKYIFYIFRELDMNDFLNVSAVPSINMDLLKSHRFPITPDNEDQQKIASFLDSKTSKLNKTIEKDKKLIALLKEKRTALINHAVTKGLDPNVKLKDSGIEWIGEIPEGWEVKSLNKGISFLTDFEANGSFSTIKEKVNLDSKEEYAWFVRATDLENDRDENNEKSHFCDKESYGFLRKTALFGGELLVSKRGEIGKVYLMPKINKPATLAPNLYLIKLNSRLIPKFTYYYFVSTIGKDRLIIKNKSTTIGALYKDDVKDVEVFYPSKEEQNKIVQYIDKATSKIDKTIQKIEEKIKLLEEYKKSLIHYVVTGKVDVRGVEA